MLALAVVMAALVACSSETTPGSQHGEGVYIPEEWQTARTVDGHHEHVVLEKIACNKCHEDSAKQDWVFTQNYNVLPAAAPRSK